MREVMFDFGTSWGKINLGPRPQNKILVPFKADLHGKIFANDCRMRFL